MPLKINAFVVGTGVPTEYTWKLTLEPAVVNVKAPLLNNIPEILPDPPLSTMIVGAPDPDPQITCF